MEIIYFIKAFDEWLFLVINGLPHPVVFDQIFLFFSFYPVIIWFLIGLVIVVIEEREEKLFICRLLLALFFSGLLASGLIKPLVKRPRPDITHGKNVIAVREQPSMFGWNNDFAFPSGHAAAAFAGAYVILREETKARHSKQHTQKRKKIIKKILWLIALLTAFSRIYLGKHYPIDVISGALLGWWVGWAAWKLVDLISPAEVQ